MNNIYKKLSFNDFYAEFQRVRPANFSNEGLRALYNYLRDMGGIADLDVVAICCDFREVCDDDEEREDVANADIIAQLTDSVLCFNR